MEVVLTLKPFSNEGEYTPPGRLIWVTPERAAELIRNGLAKPEEPDFKAFRLKIEAAGGARVEVDAKTEARVEAAVEWKRRSPDG
jgi:hypothetical protein